MQRNDGTTELSNEDDSDGSGFPASALVETHSATVWFFGDLVYKIKKPVDLGFLDFRSLESRSDACRREVDLNRRLAPDVYLGVSELRNPEGSVIDYLVTMRRMPESARLSRCLDRGDVLKPALRKVAADIAELHSTPSQGPELVNVATRDAVRGHWTDGFAQLAPQVGLGVDRSTERRIEDLALRFLQGRERLFDWRISSGQIRDGHGDLQAEDIFLLEDGPRILDCLEFDDDLRWGDVLIDVGFLAMDLERLGRVDLAEDFLAAYRESSGATWPAALAHHYIAYRAHVRAKVGVIRAVQSGRTPSGIEAFQQVCLRHLEAGRVRLVLIGGLPGTGKSTVAAALGAEVGGVVLRSDEIRRRIPGPDPYGAPAIDATYRKLLEEAENLLEMGEQVILDATWSDAAHRDMARLVADRATADLVEIECVAPKEVCDTRIQRRLAEGTDPSEATPAVAEAMEKRFAPWPRATPVATDRSRKESLLAAAEAGGYSIPTRV